MNEELQQLLQEGAAELGVELSETQKAQLGVFYREIELWNPRLGLVNASGAELVRKHFLDSLAAVPLLRERLAGVSAAAGVRAADLGSGNGFPGVVLQIALPQLRMTLVERSAKRCGFLRNAAALLPQLPLAVEQSELAQVGGSLAGQFDLVVSRAFRPLLAEITADMRRITADSGIWALYKGDPLRTRTELDTAGIPGEVVPVAVPGGAEQRCIAFCTWQALAGATD